MSADTEQFNQDESLDDSVELLIRRFGYNDALGRLKAAESKVLQRRAEAARRGDLTEVDEQ